MLHPASPEQLAVIELSKTQDVLVDAVAGSGKSTTILHAAHYRTRTLAITYSRGLNDEFKDRVHRCGFSHRIVCKTNHGFTARFFGVDCRTDEELRALWTPELTPEARHSFATYYDLLVFDEVQDVNSARFLMMYRLITATPARVILLGDRCQSVFGFLGADERYLTLADRLFLGRPWVRSPLTVTYRSSRRMVSFINEAVLQETRLVSAPSAPRGVVRYFTGDLWYDPAFVDALVEQIVTAICQHNIENITIVSSSFGSSTPVFQLTNKLSQTHGVPLYIPSLRRDDGGTRMAHLERYKLKCLTLCGAKGRESGVVIFVGFDDYLLQPRGGEVPRHRIPPSIYVGLTRSITELWVVQSTFTGPLRCLDLPAAIRHADCVNGYPVRVRARGAAPVNRHLSVTTLLRHLPEAVMVRALTHLVIETLRPPGVALVLPVETQQPKRLVEDIAHLNGIAIPAAFQYATTGICHLFPPTLPVPPPGQWAPFFLERAQEYDNAKTNFHHSVVQVTEFAWLPQGVFDQCQQRLASLFPDGREGLVFEKCMYASDRLELHGRILVGEADIVDPVHGRLLEIKCTAELEPAHALQVALYGYLSGDPQCALFLYNTRTDELQRIRPRGACFRDMVHLLIAAKLNLNPVTLTDDQFVHQALATLPEAEP